MTAVTFRRLLALLALLTPTAFLQRSEPVQTDAARGSVHLSSAAETVFRHYI